MVICKFWSMRQKMLDGHITPRKVYSKAFSRAVLKMPSRLWKKLNMQIGTAMWQSMQVLAQLQMHPQIPVLFIM